MKKIAVANDLSGFGRCSLTAAIPIISASGVQCCPLVTGVFSNQTDYPSFYGTDLTDYMTPCINKWKEMSFSFDGILTGYIANSKQGEILSDFIDEFSKNDTLIVVDPVMGDGGEVYKGFGEKRIKAIRNLVKKAHIITPNLTELCILSGEDYNEISVFSEKELLRKTEEMSRKLLTDRLFSVVTTGIHSEDKIINCVLESEKFHAVYTNSRGGRFSGTGDIFSSIIISEYVKGISVKSAVEKSVDFIYKCICETVKEENCDKNNGVCFEKFMKDLG